MISRKDFEKEFIERYDELYSYPDNYYVTGVFGEDSERAAIHASIVVAWDILKQQLKAQKDEWGRTKGAEL